MADKKAALSAKSEAPNCSPVQPSLAQFLLQRKRSWPLIFDSPEACKVHEAIGRMMALGVQPYSVVDDNGLKIFSEYWNKSMQFQAESFFYKSNSGFE